MFTIKFDKSGSQWVRTTTDGKTQDVSLDDVKLELQGLAFKNADVETKNGSEVINIADLLDEDFDDLGVTSISVAYSI